MQLSVALKAINQFNNVSLLTVSSKAEIPLGDSTGSNCKGGKRIEGIIGEYDAR
jgi:hypothetical protein